MFCLLIAHAFSFHLSIDFGSQFIKSSIVMPKQNPKIASDSKTITPSYIALHNLPNFDSNNTHSLTAIEIMNLNPVFGESALELISRKPWLGSSFLSSSIGYLENESYRILEDLYVNTTSMRLLSRNYLSSLLLRLYINSVSHNKVVHSVSVVVPASFTIPQRKEVESFFDESGFYFKGCVDDTEAISSLYLSEKSDEFSEKPKTVLFIDIGATSIKSYCIKFENLKNKIPQATTLSYSYLNEQGGAYLTKNLVIHIIEKYNLTDLSESDYQRLFNAAEQIKIKLTSMFSASYYIENINNGNLEIEITRSEFEAISSLLIQQTIEIAKNASKNIDVDSIEIIGGSSHIPIILYSIQNHFNSSHIGYSINADHSLCTGASYNSQIKDGINQLRDASIESFSLYNVTLKLSNNKSFTICKQNAKCIEKIEVDGQIEQFEIVYENINTSLLKTNSFGYKVDAMTNTTLLIKFSNSIPVYPVSVHNCDNEQVCQRVFLQPIVSKNKALSSFQKIKKQKIIEARDKLEILALKVIKELNQNKTINDFTNSEQRQKIKSAANQAMKTIREDFDTIKDDKVLISTYNQIYNDMQIIDNRIRENRTLESSIFLMNHTLSYAKQKLAEWRKKSDVQNVDEVIELANLLDKYKKWYKDAIKNIQNTPAWKERKVKSKDFQKNSETLNQKVVRISKIMDKDTDVDFSKLFNGAFNDIFKGFMKNKSIHFYF